MNRNVHGQSDYTALKQAHLREILAKHLAIVRTLAAKYPERLREYCYLDLYAGPGMSEAGLGSPLIFLDVAFDQDMPTRALFVEQNPDRMRELRRQVGDAADCRQGDCADHAPAWLHARVLAAAASNHWVRGLVYADPNGELDWDVLNELLAICPYLDVLLYYSANMRKRVRMCGKTHQHDELATLLDRLGKRQWFVRDLAGHKEWTFLFGTNFDQQDGIRKIGFYAKESERGAASFRKANFTREERISLGIPGQLGLFASERGR